MAHITHSGIDGLQWRELLLLGRFSHCRFAMNISNDGQGVVGTCTRVTWYIAIHPTISEIVS